jgi:hypothetical protein
MSDEPRPPIRTGRAYQDALKDDPAAQVAWQRVQTQLQAFGERVRTILQSTDATRAAAAKRAEDSLQPYRELGAALGAALNGEFERLRAMAEAYPRLRQAADQLERAVRELRQRDERRCDALAERLQDAVAGVSDRFGPPLAAFEDPAFWSTIVPVGERIRDAVRDAMREQAGSQRGTASAADVVAQLERYRAAGGPYLDQRTFAQLCDCGTTTINKAIKQNVTLRRWKDAALRARRQKAAPRRDAGDFDIVTEQVAAASLEPVMAEDADRLLQELRRQAATNPEWLETIDNMSADQQARMVQLYASGDYELSPLEDDPPGRPRKTKYHGRV